MEIYMTRLLLRIGSVNAVEGCHHTGGTLLGTYQKLHKETLHRTFLAMLMGNKAIGKDIILGSGQGLNGAITAMMVGEDKSVGTHHYARAEISKVNHCILQASSLCVIQITGSHLQSQTLHRFRCLAVYPAQHPHSLVGICSHGESQHD